MWVYEEGLTFFLKNIKNEVRRVKRTLPIERICVHGRHDESRVISADGDQAQIKRSAEFSDLLKGRAIRVIMFGAVVVDVLGQLRHSSISSVTPEPDLLAAALDAPAGPERMAPIERRSGACVLAREAADAGEDI